MISEADTVLLILKCASSYFFDIALKCFNAVHHQMAKSYSELDHNTVKSVSHKRNPVSLQNTMRLFSWHMFGVLCYYMEFGLRAL